MEKTYTMTALKWVGCFTIAIAPWFLPIPEGLTFTGWLYAGLFLAVIFGFFLEVAHPAIVSLIGLLVALFLRIGTPGSDNVFPFHTPAPETLRWGFSGFSSPLVWLVFALSTLGIAFEKTGLSVKIAHTLIRCLGKKTLALGYAVTFTETLLALVIPSSTARSCGVVKQMIRGIPTLCKTGPTNSPRTVGSYLVWVSFASSCIASSLFLTAFIPNIIALDMLQLSHLPIPNWRTWFIAIAPAGILLLLLTPLLTLWLYPPEKKELEIYPNENDGIIPQSYSKKRKQILLILCFFLAIIAWVVGEPYGITAPAVALLLIVLLILCRILDWSDVISNSRGWNILIWLGTMLSFASGLDNTGVLDWLLSRTMLFTNTFTPNISVIILVIFFFFARYFLAGSETYVAILLPLVLAAGSELAGMTPADAAQFGLLLSLLAGISAILTPYATGQGMIWLSTGYIKIGEFCFLGLVFGVIYLSIFLAIVMPWIYWSGMVS